jgi:hypothetical protein
MVIGQRSFYHTLDAGGAEQEEQPSQIERQQARRRRCPEFGPAASAVLNLAKSRALTWRKELKLPGRALSTRRDVGSRTWFLLLVVFKA